MKLLDKLKYLALLGGIFASSSVLAADPPVSSEQADIQQLYALVNQWYMSFLLPLGSILAGIIILIAGIMYISSAGDASKTGKAKELIFGALTGLIILVTASLIIRTLLA